MFITIEGIDGVGKTTQTNLLTEYLRNKDLNATATKEPGGTTVGKIGEFIQELIKFDNTLDSMTDLLLIYAARRRHIIELIEPAIGKGDFVVCDRFYHSTVAYLCYRDDNIDYDNLDTDAIFLKNLQMVDFLHKEFANNLKPYLTILIQTTIEESIKRTENRDFHSNKHDEAGEMLRNRLGKIFLYLSKKDKNCHIVDGSKSVEDVRKDIIAIVEKNLQLFI